MGGNIVSITRDNGNNEKETLEQFDTENTVTIRALRRYLEREYRLSDSDK